MVYNALVTPAQLIAWRKKDGYSQKQLAELLMVDVMTVSRWERGVRSIPSFLHLALECLELKGGGQKKSRGTTKTKKERG